MSRRTQKLVRLCFGGPRESYVHEKKSLLGGGKKQDRLLGEKVFSGVVNLRKNNLRAESEDESYLGGIILCAQKRGGQKTRCAGVKTVKGSQKTVQTVERTCGNL